MSNFRTCPNCGTICDTAKAYAVRPSVISSNEYVCSLRCKDEYEARYNRKKQTAHETSKGQIGLNLLVEVIIGFAILAAIVAAFPK